MLVLLFEVCDVVFEGRLGNVKSEVRCLTAGLLEGSKEMLDLARVAAESYMSVDISYVSSCAITNPAPRSISTTSS